MTSCQIPSCVDAEDCQGLDLSVASQDPSRSILLVTCARCGEKQRAAVAFTYHDGASRLFVLVLPEASRHRELIERADLLVALSREAASLPSYVIEFSVVYAESGLACLLNEWCKEHDARLHSGGKDVLTSAASLASDASEPSATTTIVSGIASTTSSVLTTPAAALELGPRGVATRATEVQAIVQPLQAAANKSMFDESAADEQTSKIIPLSRVPLANQATVRADSCLAVFSDEVQGDADTPQLDAPVARQWPAGKTEGCFTRLSGERVLLGTAKAAKELEELLADDLRVLIQLHRLPTYPLVTLILCSEGTLSSKKGAPCSFHFDINNIQDMDVLGRLSKEFRFDLAVFDSEKKLVRERLVSAPLADNVEFVIGLARATLLDMSGPAPDYLRALEGFNSERFDRFGRGHRLAGDFRDGWLDALDSPRKIFRAVAQCERFSSEEGQDYLVATRSYPLSLWRRRRLRVIERAVEVGIWVGPALADVGVSEQLAEHREALVRRCYTNFADSLRRSVLVFSEDSVRANWAALGVELEALGLSEPTALRVQPDVLVGAEEKRLLLELADPSLRLEAVIALCQLSDISGLDPIFRGIAELEIGELPAAFAAVAGLGNRSADSLLVLQSCPVAHLRQGATLCLCELGNEAGIDATCDSLMNSEGTVWREYAVALSRVGAPAVMPLVARIAESDERGHTRAIWALGYLALGGARKAVATLAEGRDQRVAYVAKSALELAIHLADKSVAVDRSPPEKQLSDSFYRAIAGHSPGLVSSELSGAAMLLDESDLIEAL